MALRDEILKQKALKEQQEELAEIERKKQEEIIALQKQQKAEEEKNKKYSEYFALKEQVEAGNIPQEWVDIYERLIEKAKAALLEGREEFEIKESSTQQYYQNKLDNGVGEHCELNLMNKYLTDRLIADGFKQASFKLEKVPEYYATKADYDEQSRLQKQYDKQAEEANDRARQKWMYDSFDGINQPTPAYIYPKLASLKKSGVKYRYEIIAKGSLYEKKQKAKSNGGTAKGRKIFGILGIALVVIGVAVGVLLHLYA